MKIGFRHWGGLIPGLVVSLAVQAGEAAPTPEITPEQGRAQAAMVDLGQRLRSALQAKMQAEGPVAAVDFCHVNAPRIAAEVEAERGVKVGRTSLRHRSQANAPMDWQQAVLEDFAERAQSVSPAELWYYSRTPEHMRVARGIAVEGVCLVCHGRTIAEPVKAAIDARYPGDRATGFSEGDLRGLIWAEVPIEPAPAVPTE